LCSARSLSMFGATGSGFGGSTSAPLFGGSTGTTAPAGTNSLFGGNTATGATNSLFGGGTTTGTTNSLFGGGTTTGATTTNSLFGGGSTTGTTNSLFGGSTTPTGTTNSLFGGSTTPTGTTGSLFGGGTAAAPAATGSLFGASTTPTTGGLFGGATGTTNSLFGGSTNTAAPAFGATNSLFGAGQPSLATPTKTEALGAPGFQSTVQQMFEEMQAKNSPRYALNAYVYDRSNVPQSKRSVSQVSDEVQKAMNSNPDPDHLIPVRIQGFEDLETRVQAQDAESKESEEALRKEEEYLKEVEADITSVVESVLPSLLRSYRRLSAQLLQTVVMLRQCAGSAYISSDMRVIQAKLEDIESIASDPTKVCARLDALVEQVRSVAAAHDAPEGATTFSRDEINLFAKHLEEEQSALQSLVQLIHRCEQMEQKVVGSRQ